MRTAHLCLLVSIALGAYLVACSDDESASDTGPTSDAEADADPATDTGDAGDDPAIDADDDSGAPDTGDGGLDGDTGVEDADAADLGDDSTAGDSDATDALADADAGTECLSACDCPQGEACNDGACLLGAAPVFCCTQPDCTPGLVCTDAAGEVATCGATLAATFGEVVFNEVLIDGASDGDPNGDGEGGDPVGDEFVELVNRSEAAVDLAGYTLVETTFPSVPRHTFGGSALLAPGDAIVVFGGGSAPDDIPGARLVVANADDPGVPFGLSLDNGADTLRLLDPDGDLVAVFAWGATQALAPLSDEAYTRSPDLIGDFVPHTTANPERLFSPGTRADGESF